MYRADAVKNVVGQMPVPQIKSNRPEDVEYNKAMIDSFTTVIKCVDLPEIIIERLQHPDLVNERRYGFQGGIDFAIETILDCVKEIEEI